MSLHARRESGYLDVKELASRLRGKGMKNSFIHL